MFQNEMDWKKEIGKKGDRREISLIWYRFLDVIASAAWQSLNVDAFFL